MINATKERFCALLQHTRCRIVPFYGSPLSLWVVRGLRHAGVLCARASQPMVHPRLRGGLRIGVGLRISPRGVAVRTCGSDLVRCGRAPMVVDELIRGDAAQRESINGNPGGSPASQRRTASASTRPIARRSAILAFTLVR